jgi:hypothetical protein
MLISFPPSADRYGRLSDPPSFALRRLPILQFLMKKSLPKYVPDLW